jgi:hypothetical protein
VPTYGPKPNAAAAAVIGEPVRPETVDETGAQGGHERSALGIQRIGVDSHNCRYFCVLFQKPCILEKRAS